jgi:hypothetical protein
MMTPVTQKLNAAKKKHFSKYVLVNLYTALSPQVIDRLY